VASINRYAVSIGVLYAKEIMSKKHFVRDLSLLSLMASKDQVGWVWNNWLSGRLKKHSKTDSRIELRLVRLAADGVWLERIMNAKAKNLRASKNISLR
jgi:hypothetical protein